MPDGKRVCIVGGVAGGASAAARARRLSEDAEIVVFERGGHISFANCGMPYYIGGHIPDRDRLLVQTPEKMWQRFRVDVRLSSEVVRIDREQRKLFVRDLENDEEYTESYDELILSPGAKPIRPDIPGAHGEHVFTLRNLEDMDRIRATVEKQQPSRAVVVGGGYIGLEMTEALRNQGIDVSLVELADQVFLPADPEMVAPIHTELEKHGVELRLKTSITSVKQEGNRLQAHLSNGEAIDTDMVILAVGVRPESDLAQDAGLEVGESGGIVVDERMRTSDPHIYAVGDAVEVNHLVNGQKTLIPLAGPANRQGRIAADNALGRESTYGTTQGTAICKVFDQSIGLTGLAEKALKKSDTEYEKVYVHPASHASYYPGARQLSLKLLFSPEDGKVLGAQAVGPQSVDKRIDVLAVALREGLTVYDLQEQELAYAPPYGSAKDPVDYAGFVAGNVLSGDMPVCHVDDVQDSGPDEVLLDVRTEAEVEAGTVPGAVNIPLDELRDRLDEVPRDKEILAFCQVGLRGYLACRILQQNGFQCRNLTGGYKTYRDWMGMEPEEEPDEEMTEDTGEHSSALVSEGSPSDNSSDHADVVSHVDARALQCPGPLMRLKAELDEIDRGRAVAIATEDPGFPRDVRAWCENTGNQLLELEPVDGEFHAVVRKGVAVSHDTESKPAHGISTKKKSIVVFSGDFDKAMAAFIIANGAATMGSEVTMFFTFWGLNILRKPEKVEADKNFVEKMFGWMMPRGADRLNLSKMNMGGMGKRMIQGIMRKKNVSSLPELIESARDAGVRLVACSMSMDLMGIKREELIDGVDEGGVASYLHTAESGNVNLFV